ncbi:MAG: hypothetical protein EP343_04610 [Deltaproteobacteria bacterium]|nr:MAG: hypothetical protein EP343_04610 [Deltaproteobacteria bacterium]
MRRCWHPLLWLGIWILTGCGGPTVQPLQDATFRLESVTLNDCKKSTQAQTCMTDIKGVIDERAVTEPGETVADCQQCVFNQKISLLDGGGTRHTFYYKLPNSQPIPVKLGEPAQLFFIDASRVGKGFAMSFRDQNGNLIAAMSSGQGGEFLDQEQRLGQVTITTDAENVAGEEATECGTKVYRNLQLKAGETSIQAAPGETKTLESTIRSYLFTNINRYSWKNSTCSDRSTPYAYIVYRTATSN